MIGIAVILTGIAIIILSIQVGRLNHKVSKLEEWKEGLNDREFKWIGKKFDEVIKLTIPEAIEPLKKEIEKLKNK